MGTLSKVGREALVASVDRGDHKGSDASVVQ